jgi:hypothetical protein
VPASRKILGAVAAVAAVVALAACSDSGSHKLTTTKAGQAPTAKSGTNLGSGGGLSTPGGGNDVQAGGQPGAPQGQGQPSASPAPGDGAPAQGNSQFNPDDFKAKPVPPITAGTGGEPLHATPAAPIQATPAEPIHATPAEPIHPVPVDPSQLNNGK